MEIVKLPYFPPVQQITAWHRSGTLEEHLLGFLAKNGALRVTPRESLPENSVGWVFQEVASKTELPMFCLKRHARQLKLLTEGDIPYQKALHYLSRCLGYRTYEELKKHADERKPIRNVGLME